MKRNEQRERKRQIMEDPEMSFADKTRELNILREPYRYMTDAELLQLVRDFAEQYGRPPERSDLVYDTILKQRFGPWNRMLEQAGVKEVSETYLRRKRRRKEKRASSRKCRREETNTEEMRTEETNT